MDALLTPKMLRIYFHFCKIYQVVALLPVIYTSYIIKHYDHFMGLFGAALIFLMLFAVLYFRLRWKHISVRYEMFQFVAVFVYFICVVPFWPGVLTKPSQYSSTFRARAENNVISEPIQKANGEAFSYSLNDKVNEIKGVNRDIIKLVFEDAVQHALEAATESGDGVFTSDKVYPQTESPEDKTNFGKDNEYKYYIANFILSFLMIPCQAFACVIAKRIAPGQVNARAAPQNQEETPLQELASPVS